MSQSPAKHGIPSNSKTPKWWNLLHVLVSLLGLSKALSGSGADFQENVCKVASVHGHEIYLEGECIAFIRSSKECETSSEIIENTSLR